MSDDMIDEFKPMRNKAAPRVNFGPLYDCLPGRISFTDIDGGVEIGGKILFLEVKSHRGGLGYAQRTFLERLTAKSPDIGAMVVVGDADTCEADEMTWIHDGKTDEWQASSLEDIRTIICEFSRWARPGCKLLALDRA